MVAPPRPAKTNSVQRGQSACTAARKARPEPTNTASTGSRVRRWPTVSATRPIIAAWRVLSGTASEKGKEAAVTHALIEQVLAVAGPKAISLLLADAFYADGPLLAWLKYAKGIDVLVRLPEDRLLYQDVQGLAEAQLIEWTHHRYVRTVQGHKHIREVEVTAAAEQQGASTQEMAAAAGSLLQAAEKLRALVAEFRV